MKKKHQTNCQCDGCKLGIDELVKREDEQMKLHGWIAHAVMDDTSLPLGFNYHTHGLNETFGHLDFQIVAPVDLKIAHSIVNILIKKIKDGEKFKDGDRVSDVIKKYDLIMMLAEECDRPVLRIILPDQDGNLLKHNMATPYDCQWDTKKREVEVVAEDGR